MTCAPVISIQTSLETKKPQRLCPLAKISTYRAC